MSPNITEMVFALGIDPRRIVGVTRYCDYPPVAQSIAKVGGIVDPSVEVIFALHPDLVLATRGNPVSVIDRLRSAGVPVFAFDSQTGLEQIPRTMRTLSRILGGVQAEGLGRIDSLLTALECYGRLAESVPPGERPNVLYYDPLSPDWTAGPGTHIDEVIRLAGARNLASDSPVAWPKYSLEALLARPPDWILVALPGTGGPSREEILKQLRDRPGWRSLRALQEGRICCVPADPLMRPGPRTLGMVRLLGECLHPRQSWECSP